MNGFKPIATFWLLASALQLASFGQSAPGLRVTVRTESPTFEQGATIRLQITVTNVSDHPIVIYSASGSPNGGEAEDDFAISLRRTSGGSLPRIDGRNLVRKDGKTIKVPTALPSRRGLTLKPGEQFLDYATLSRLFNLNELGTYTVSVAQDLRPDSSAPHSSLVTATSNVIQFAVTKRSKDQ
jgi:uncharacterized protein (DUF58 family)